MPLSTKSNPLADVDNRDVKRFIQLCERRGTLPSATFKHLLDSYKSYRGLDENWNERRPKSASSAA